MPNQNNKKVLLYCDPGKILDLCVNGADVNSSQLQTLINTYFQEEFEAELVATIVIDLSHNDAFTEAVGSELLPVRMHLSLSDSFMGILKNRTGQTMLFEHLEEPVKNVFMCIKSKLCTIYACPHFQAKEVLNRKRVHIMPYNQYPYAVFCVIVKPNIHDDLIPEIFFESMQYIWSSLKRTIAHGYEKKQKTRCQELLRASRRMFSQVADKDKLIQVIIMEVMKVTTAEFCTLLLLDSETMTLVEPYQCVSAVGSWVWVPSGKSYSLEKGIVGQVLATGQPINSHCGQVQYLFDPKIDRRDCINAIKNLLFFPIRDRTGIVGVGQLFNKMQAGACKFSVGDEQSVVSLGVQAGACLQHAVHYRALLDVYTRTAICGEMRLYHMTIDDKEFVKVMECPHAHLNPNIKNVYMNWRTLPPPEYPCYILKMFENLNLLKKFDIKRETMVRFILMTKKCYRDVPHHNWQQAVGTFQCMYACIESFQLIIFGYLTHMQALMLLIACLVHDLDHRGSTVSLDIGGEPTFAALFSSDGGLLERHHLSQALALQAAPGCDLLAALPQTDFHRALIMLRDNILATNLATAFKNMDEYEIIALDGYQKHNAVHSGALQALLMLAADHRPWVMDWDSVKKSTTTALTELFRPGAVESLSRLEPPEGQEPCVIPDLMVNFYRRFVMPLFRILGMIIAEWETAFTVAENYAEKWENTRLVLSEVTPMAGLQVLLSPELDNLVELKLKELAELGAEEQVVEE